jgi:hypothetical protein
MTKGRALPNNDGCTFCGNRPLTKEHIWGQWVLEHVSRTTNKYQFGKVILGKNNKDTTEDSRMRTGDPLNANVRVVCSNCNNGWMSQIQESAKPHLIPLFKGESVWLDKKAQAAIATWAMMSTITAEHIQRNPSETTVPQADRTSFMKGQPLANWKVWIAPYRRDKWIGQWVHSSVPIYSAGDTAPVTDDGRPRPNAQNTTFVVGQLYVHTMSGPYPNFVHDWDWRGTDRARDLLRQIYPTVYQRIAWPSTELTDDDAIKFATAFQNFIRRIDLSRTFD